MIARAIFLLSVAAVATLCFLAAWQAGYNSGYAKSAECTHGESSAVYDSRTGKTQVLGVSGCMEAP